MSDVSGKETVNRYRKAKVLARVVREHGGTAETWSGADELHRQLVLELARVTGDVNWGAASDATWDLVQAMLEDDE